MRPSILRAGARLVVQARPMRLLRSVEGMRRGAGASREVRPVAAAAGPWVRATVGGRLCAAVHILRVVRSEILRLPLTLGDERGGEGDRVVTIPARLAEEFPLA